MNDIAWDANAPTFRPPWWLANGHAQTLAGAYWPGPLPDYGADQRHVMLDDGDVLVVHDDCPPGWQPGGKAVLLTHGLSGSHRSPQLVRLSHKFHARGVRVFRLDLRGCGAGAGLARHPYHAGCSDDLARVVEEIIEWCQPSENEGNGIAYANPLSLTLFGVSLGGNILLKYLGEDPDRVPPQVEQAIAVNPPIDLARSIQTLDHPVNRWYDSYFTGALRRHLEDRLRRLPDAPRPSSVLRTRRLYDFDNWYTAPISGFGSAEEYYEQCSACQFVPTIRVPTTILTASDDPMVPAEMFQQHCCQWPANVELTITPGGGHLGYVAQRGIDPDVHWLDWRVINMVMREPAQQVA